MGRAQNAVPTESAPLRATWVPNLSSLDRGGACSLGPASEDSRRSNVEPQRFVRRKQGQALWGWDTVCTRQCYLFAASLPPHSANEQARLKNKNVSTTAPPVSGRKSDTEGTSKQKLNRGNRLGSDPTLPRTPEKELDISLLFLRSFFFCCCFLLMLLCGCFFFYFFLLTF